MNSDINLGKRDEVVHAVPHNLLQSLPINSDQFDRVDSVRYLCFINRAPFFSVAMTPSSNSDSPLSNLAAKVCLDSGA
jgi:hypothetical protein